MTSSPRRRVVLLLLHGFGVLVLVFTLGAWIACGISVFKHADLAYLATARAAAATAEYVRQRGKWPASWEDLESLPSPTRDLILEEGGWQEVRAYVVMDFNLSLREVAAQRMENFDGIKPLDPVWGNYRSLFYELLETVRTTVREGDQERTVE